MVTAQDNRPLTYLVGAVGSLLVMGILVYTIASEVEYERQADYQFLPSWQIVASVLGPAVIASVVGGFMFMRKAPMICAMLVTFGAVSFAIMFYWLIVPEVIAIALAVYAFRRARRIQSGG